MPFRSEAQRKYLWAKHPKIAEKWSHKYGSEPQGRKEAIKRRINGEQSKAK